MRDASRTSLAGLGLPLALSALAALCLLVVLALFLSDRQLAGAYEEAERGELLAVARSFAGETNGPGALDAPRDLRARLERLRSEQPDLREATVYGRAPDGRPIRVASTARTDARAPIPSRVLSPIDDGRFVYRERTGDRHEGLVVYPVRDGEARPVAALALTYDLTPREARRDARQRATARVLVAGAMLLAAALALAVALMLRGVRQAAGRADDAGEEEGDDEVEAPVPVPISAFDPATGSVPPPAPEPLDDHLTGVLTEQGFAEQLAAELRRAQLEGYRMTVVVLELDRLDRFDVDGAAAARLDALRLVADRIRSELHVGDLCGRAGSIFLLALAQTGGGMKAEDVVHRIQTAVGALEFVPLRERLTLSAGTAQFPYAGTGASELTAMATRALMESQAAGGNRCTEHTEDSDAPPEPPANPTFAQKAARDRAAMRALDDRLDR